MAMSKKTALVTQLESSVDFLRHQHRRAKTDAERAQIAKELSAAKGQLVAARMASKTEAAS